MQTLYFGFYFWLLPFHKQPPQQVVPHVWFSRVLNAPDRIKLSTPHMSSQCVNDWATEAQTIAEWLPHPNRCCMCKWCPAYSAWSHSKIWKSQKNQCIKGFGDTNVFFFFFYVTVSNVKVMYFGKKDIFCLQHEPGLRVTDWYWLTMVSISTQMKNCVQWMTNNLCPETQISCYYFMNFCEYLTLSVFCTSQPQNPTLSGNNLCQVQSD